MNKQSNTYTIIYTMIMVVVVGVALAGTSLLLKPQQQANADADKMRQILASAHIIPTQEEIPTDFARYITDSFVIDSAGKRIEGNAFDINVAQQSKLSVESRSLPVFVCTLSPNEVKYIIPVYGAGLWGPIWGYIALNDDGKTIYGAYFAHQGETPGLGAEIDKSHFSDQFKGKSLFKDNTFKPIAVIKTGQKPINGEDYVDAISGGTITSKGVQSMLENCLSGYTVFLQNINNSTK